MPLNEAETRSTIPSHLLSGAQRPWPARMQPLSASGAVKSRRACRVSLLRSASWQRPAELQAWVGVAGGAIEAGVEVLRHRSRRAAGQEQLSEAGAGVPVSVPGLVDGHHHVAHRGQAADMPKGVGPVTGEAVSEDGHRVAARRAAELPARSSRTTSERPRVRVGVDGPGRPGVRAKTSRIWPMCSLPDHAPPGLGAGAGISCTQSGTAGICEVANGASRSWDSVLTVLCVVKTWWRARPSSGAARWS